MPRTVSEWIGRNDDAMPGKLVRDRLSRDQNDCCAHCHQPFGPKRRAHCDHVVALIDGGENREANLQMLCADCHVAKTGKEASDRKHTRNIRASHIMARPPSKWQSQGFAKADPQRKASTPLSDKFTNFRRNAQEQ